MKRLGIYLLFCLSLCIGVGAEPQDQVQTRIITEGYGKDVVGPGDLATVAYTLRLVSGEIIDASPDDKPFSFQVGAKNVVSGMSQGVLGMKTGETRNILIPPALAYGAVANGPIPPNSTLDFEIKLVRIDKPSHADPDLSEIFGRDGFGSRPSAQELTKPAVFEYLIRDFFSRPWRYPDAAELVWKTNGVLTGVAFLLFLLVLRLPSGTSEQE